MGVSLRDASKESVGGLGNFKLFFLVIDDLSGPISFVSLTRPGFRAFTLRALVIFGEGADETFQNMERRRRD
jgi:hypothetical protein